MDLSIQQESLLLEKFVPLLSHRHVVIHPYTGYMFVGCYVQDTVPGPTDIQIMGKLELYQI